VIIRHTALSQDPVCNLGSLTCCFIKDSFQGSDTVSCHVFSSIKCSGHECVLFSILGIHVYLCHQHITFKFPHSLESPLPAPPEHSRKLKTGAAGNTQADTRSFLCSLCFLAPGETDAQPSAPLCWLVPGHGTEPRPKLPIIMKRCFSWQGDQHLPDPVQGQARLKTVLTNSLRRD